MRNIYLLLILFLIACIVSAEVYIYQVKSIGFFQAPAISSALWLIELLLMLLVACFIGLAIGWYLRQDTIASLQNELGRVGQEQEQEKIQWVAKLQKTEEEADKIKTKLSRAQESFKEDFKVQLREKERLKENIAFLETELKEIKETSDQLRTSSDAQLKEYEQIIRENALLKDRLEKMQVEIDQFRSGVNKAFTLPPKDDLKLIAGIGPALEKKLNGLGIYSFRQISELTPLAINEITNSIKFFPGRIERDNWVSQARNFEEEKKRQSGAIS